MLALLCEGSVRERELALCLGNAHVCLRFSEDGGEVQALLRLGPGLGVGFCFERQCARLLQDILEGFQVFCQDSVVH